MILLNNKAIHFLNYILSKNKITRIIFLIFIILVVLEISLRMGGFFYNLKYKLPVVRDGNFRIFCVGESTTWGLGARNPVLGGYPHQLELLLNQKFPFHQVQCLFENTIGQNTSENLIKLPRYIEKYKPDVIVFMIGANNWWNMDVSNILLFTESSISRYYWKILIFLDQFRVWKLLKNVIFSCGLYKERWDYYFPDDKRDEMTNPSKYKRSTIFDKVAAHDQ